MVERCVTRPDSSDKSLAWFFSATQRLRFEQPDVALSGTSNTFLCLARYELISPSAVDAIKAHVCNSAGNTPNFTRWQRDQVGVGIHERNPSLSRDHLNRVPGEQHSILVRAGLPFQNRASLKVSTQPMKDNARQHLAPISQPRSNMLAGACDICQISLGQQDRHAAQGFAPFHHASIEMWVRQADGLDATELQNAVSRFPVQNRGAIP